LWVAGIGVAAGDVSTCNAVGSGVVEACACLAIINSARVVVIAVHFCVDTIAI